ncbi:MAG: alpha-1,2-mannosidase [Bacteroidales bacterium]|nr:alpha-1,2-mannosidase [Bacteroidales bacterium]
MKIKNIKLIALVSALLFMAVGCDRPFEFDRPLAVSSRSVKLTKDAGETHVIVYSNGAWNARLTEPVKWASLDKLSGEGMNDVLFSYSANYGVARQVGIVFTCGEAVDTVMMTQAGAVTEASVVFDNVAINLTKAESDVNVPMTTNFRYGVENIRTEVVFAEELDGAELTDAERWLTDVVVKQTKISFKVAENTTDFPRVAYINLDVFDPSATGNSALKETLVITQTTDDLKFSLASDSISITGFADDIVAEASVNNLWPYSDQVEFECAAEWISKIKVTKDGLAFHVAQNDDGDVRTANISFSYVDSDGNQASASLDVIQAVFPREISFADVRALGAGEIQAANFIEGVMISDHNSPNLISAKQTGQFLFDSMQSGVVSSNSVAGYIESMDAQYGFRIVFATPEDAAAFTYGSKVRINVKGLRLVKEENPERYVLDGVTADRIIEITESAGIPSKMKKMSELTDADVYTMVSLMNVEILCKDGCYTNATDGYSFKDPVTNPASGNASAPRWDVAPVLCTDTEGSAMYMLTNAACPWRRNGTNLGFYGILPQGSGTFNAIIVSEEQPTVRYGNLGRYQLRYNAASDLHLNGSPFSKTIVEWNWNSRVAAKVTPDVGEGSLNIYGATPAAASDFNNTYNGRDGDGGNGGATTNQKGLVSNAALKLTYKWWDFTANEGRYFDVNFSTSGISGTNMIFGIAWNHGAMGNTTLDSPSHWKLQYSVDGTNFKDVPECDIIQNRSIVWWTTTSQDSCPGFKEHLRKLPSECFNQEKVTIRVKVADKVCDIDPAPAAVKDDSYLNFIGIEKGTLTDKDTEIRIGTITVRYN